MRSIHDRVKDGSSRLVLCLMLCGCSQMAGRNCRVLSASPPDSISEASLQVRDLWRSQKLPGVLLMPFANPSEGWRSSEAVEEAIRRFDPLAEAQSIQDNLLNMDKRNGWRLKIKILLGLLSSLLVHESSRHRFLWWLQSDDYILALLLLWISTFYQLDISFRHGRG